MKQMMNVAYLRCSSEMQSTEHQENSIKDYCSRNDIKIDKIIKDEGISAYSKDVTARKFTEILHLAHLGQIENLIVFESSRISRQFIEGQTLIDELTKCNVSIHSVMDNRIINKDELDQLFNSFKFFMNQKASKETSERIKSSKKLLKEQGRYLGGKVLTGFKIVDGKEVVDKEAKNEVIQMFDDYVAFGGGYTIKKYNINHHQILLQKLKNPKYIKIVGKAKFNQVQKLIQDRRCNTTTRNLNRSDVLFEGLLYHKFCGHKLVIYRDKKGNPLFRCRNHCKGNPDVDVKKSFTGIKLMNNLERDILEVLDTLDENKLKERYNSRCSKNKSILSYRIKELNNLSKSKEKALILAERKLEKYIMEDASDNMIESVSNMIARVKEELDDINKELEKKQNELNAINIEENHQEELIKQVLNAKEIYKNAPIDKKKAVLNLIVKRIDIADIDSYDIYLNI